MYNSVIAVGNTFLEILQPERTSAPTQKFLNKQGGPGGYMLLLQVDDLDAARTRAEAAKVRVVMDAPKRKYHGVTGAVVHLHPADTGGVLTSFDGMEEWESRVWGGQAWLSISAPMSFPASLELKSAVPIQSGRTAVQRVYRQRC